MADAPAFQFYPADFLSDENQRAMTPAESGAYIRLICTCWIEGSIPTDFRRLAGLTGMRRDEIQEAWELLQPCFEPHPEEDGRLIHPRVEKEREKQATYREQMAAAGRKGARRRWAKERQEKADSVDNVENSAPGDEEEGATDTPSEETAPGESTEAPQIPEPDTPRKASDSGGGDRVAIASLKPGHSHPNATPMASDGSSSPTPVGEIPPPCSPPTGRGERGEGEENGGKGLHPETNRLWSDPPGGEGLRVVVQEDWHLSRERVEVGDDLMVGMGLEHRLFSELLHQTEDPDFVAWGIRHARRVFGWEEDQAVSLYWLVGDSPHAAANLERLQGEYAKGGQAIPEAVALAAAKRLRPPSTTQTPSRHMIQEARRTTA